MRAIIGVFLVAAGLNVAVAWCFAGLDRCRPIDPLRIAMWRRQTFAAEGQRPGPADEYAWIIGVYRSPGAEIVISRRGSEQSEVWFLHRAGWPAAAMQGQVRYAGDAAGYPTGSPTYVAALPFGSTITLSTPPAPKLSASTTGVLPLQPLAGGFLLNTGVYAAAIVMSMMLYRSARRLWNRLRGRCTRCGYPVGESPRCTECGATIRAGRPTARSHRDSAS